MASDKRDQLYTSLIGSGKVSEDEIGSIDEFKNALKDEQSTREFYRNLSASGLFDEDEIGNEDDFFESISSDFSQPSTPNVAQRSIQQRTDPYSYVSQAGRVKEDLEKRRNEPLSPSDIARMNRNMDTMRRGVDASMQRFDRKAQNLQKRQGLSVPQRVNLGETNNLREGEQHLNPETGELEKSYVTSSGNEYDSKVMADQEQQQIDEQARYRQWRKEHPKEAMISDIDDQIAKLDESFNNMEIDWVDTDGRIHWKGGRASDEAVRDIEVAKQDLKEARTRLERSGQLEASSDFLGGIGLPFTKDWFNNWKNFGYGVWDTLQDPSFYSFGLSDLKKAGTYVRIKNKMEKGEALTDQETAVALAGMALSHAQQIAEVPHGYTAGATTTEMAPFMLQMYANPASGVGRAFARQAVRKFGRDGIKAVSARAGARILGNIAEGAALANTLQAPGTIANTMQRYTGDSFEYGDDGKLRIGHYEKLPDNDTSVFVEGGKGLARSIWEGEASMIIENFTELGFGGNINKFLGKVANSGVGQKMGLGYLSDLVGKIGATPFARNMKHFMERTHWDGMIEEPLEEEYGIILNSLLTGDNQIKDLWDSEQQIDIFAGTMWFGGMMAAMNTAAYPYYRHKVKKALNQADIFGQESFGEEWSVIKDGIDEMSDKDVASYLYDVKGNDAYSNEQKAALFAYVSRLKQYQGASTSDMLMRMEGNLSQEETDMRNAYDRGAELTEPKDMNEAKMMMDVQHDRLSEVVSDMEMIAIENDPIGALQAIVNSEAWTDEEKQVVLDYVNARMTYEGMMDKIDDDIDSQIAFSDAMIDKKVNRDNPSMVIPATLMDDRQVSIISGSVIMLEDGTGVDRQASIEANGGDGMILTVGDTGKVEAHSLDEFRSVDDAIPVQQMKDEAASNIRQVAEQAASNNINGVLSFAQGDQYTILDEQGQEHSIQVFEDQGDGTVAVFLDDNPQVQVMAKDQLQAMSDAYRQEQMLQEQEGAAVEQQPTVQEEQQPTELEQEQQPAEQEEEPTALSKIPVKIGADGKPVMKRSGKPELEWHKASVEDAAAALIETAGGNMLVARDTASDMVNVARGKLEKIRKQKPKGDDPIEIAESRQEIKRQEQEQQDIVKQWQNVGQEIQRRMQAESAARQEAIEAAKSEEQRQREAEEARKQKERQDEIDRQRIREQIERDKERRNREYAPLVEARKELADDEEALAILNDTEPRSLEEFVSSLIRPHSMLWQDASNSELGLQSELGLKRDDMQRMMTLLGTNESGAKPFGKVVLDIYEGLTDAMKEQYTDEDVRRALLDLFNEGSSTRMMHLTEENRITEAREVARENERRADEYEMEAWAEAYHLTPEERETFDEWMQQPPTEPEQEIINQIIAENEQNRNVQRVDQQFVTGTGTTGVEGSQGQVQGEAETTGNGNVEAAVAQGTEAAAGESAVSGNEVHGRAQDRQALATLFDQIGASPVLAERMSDYDVEQLTALVEDWEIANDEYGQTIEENKDALKSKSKETREAAQKAIDDAQEQANAVFVPIEEYVEGLNVKYGIESEKPFEGAIPTPKIDKPRYDANRKALVEAYRSGDPAAITAAAQAVQQYVDEGLDAGEDHTEIFDIAEEYDGNDPEKLADQYIIRTFWDRYLDDDADQEYIKTGIKQSEQLKPTDMRDAVRVESPEIGVSEANAKAKEAAGEPQPIGTGDFGPIYDQFRGKPNEAIGFLLSKRDGEALGALSHKDIGEIDLVWGQEGTGHSDGFGLAKLVKYHPEVVDNLQDILDDMEVVKRTDNRINLESEKYKAAVRLTWNEERKTWLLTVFEKKNSALDNTTDTDKTSNRGKRNDTATPQGTVSESKDTNNSGNIQENLGKTSSAEEISSEEAKVDTNPSDAQKEAGNYQKGHINIDGYDITIENPKGSVRSGIDASGNPWETEMHNTYGYIRGTEGVDGDHIDVFLSDNPTSGNVYVVDQINDHGDFDEHKVMYGFASEEEARQAYLSNYNKGWKGLGKITEVSREDFKKWVESSHRKTKPFAEYKSVKAATKSQPTVKKPKEHKRLVSDDKMEELRKQLLAKMNNANVGIDPERMLLGAMYAVGKIERGFTKFADYAQEMVNDLGDMIRPYLKSFYNAVRDMPEAQEYAGQMDDYDTVQKFDVFNFDKQGTSTVFEKAEQVSKEQKVKRDAKKVKKEQPDLFAGSLFDAELMPQPAEQETKQEPAVQGEPKYRPLKEEDLDNNNPTVYYKGEPAHIMLITRTGEQTSATTFSKPRITSVMLTNGKSVQLSDLMVEDDMPALDKKDYRTYMTPEAREYFAKDPRFAKYAHKELAFIQAAVWDEVIIPVEELKKEPAIIEAEARINAKKGNLQLTENEVSQYAERLFDREHGSASYRDGELLGYTGEVKAEKKAFIVVGRPAGGKSSVFADPISHKYSARIIDSDTVKPWLDGYDDGYGANYVHKASTIVAERALDMAIERGENVVIPRIGGLSVVKRAIELRKKGYDVELLFNDVPEEASVMRAASRFAMKGRYLSLDYLTTIGDKVSIIFSNFVDRNIGDYERIKDEVQRLLGRPERLPGNSASTREGLRELRTDVPAGEGSTNKDVQELVGDGQLRSPEKQLVVNDDTPIFTHAEWKDNNVPFGTKPVTLWNSNDETFEDFLTRKDNDARNLQQVGEENRRGSDRVSSRESSVSRSADNSGLESDIQERRDERQGDTGVSQSDAEVSGSSTGQLRPVQGLENTLGVPDEGEETRDSSGGSADKSSGDNARVRTTTFHNNRRNNVGERGKDYAPLSPKARFNANVEAIKMMRALMDEGIEAPTKDQMEVLRQYSGWGGLGTYFNDESSAENKILRDLLSEEEYNDAVMSINSAYFTPATVIDSLWDIAKALGFKGGNVLEGSAGIGNIIGQMPKDMSRQSNIEAVEIDKITGNILKLLYPDAKVHIQGFQDTVIRNGSVDLAITNVPFVTGLHVIDKVDKDLSRRFTNIHDFCIAKNIRKLREGGIGIFISSSGTLDKSNDLRAWIADEGQTDVIGAFRLNNETFGGTKVTSDIIVVRKRIAGKTSEHSIDVAKASPLRVGTYEDKFGNEHQTTMVINDYFMAHPEMMAGKMAFGYEKGDTFRPGSYGLFPVSGKEQEKMLQQFVKEMKNKAVGEPQRTVEKTEEEPNQLTAVKEGRMLLDDKGRLCVSRLGEAVPLGLNDQKVKGQTKQQCFKDYQTVQTAVDDVLQQQLNDPNDEALKPKLAALNKAYDHFVKRYGTLHKNTAISFLRNDIDFPSFQALEIYKEEKDIKGKVIVKTSKPKLFTERVIGFKTEPQPKTVKDAVIASIFRTNGIDLEWIATKLSEVAAPPNGGNWTADDVRKGILVSRLGFEDPSTGQLVIRYKYLSGNVREKLAIAEQYNTEGETAGRYAANVEELRKVVPMDIPAHLIDFSLGSSWIPVDLYKDFVKETLDLGNVSIAHFEGSWSFNEGYSFRNEKNRVAGVYSEKFRETIYGHQLVAAALNNRPVKVSKQVTEGYGSSKTTRTVVDQAATQACAVRLDEIKDEFKQWAKKKMQDDPELARRIEKIYNDKFNAMVPMEIGDEFLPEIFDGANQTLPLYGHQKRGVMRGVTAPTMLAHEVGTGKSFTLITTAMEMRRLGTAKKPMIVVQNATVAQMTADAKLLYPNAKVLSLSEQDRDAEGRRAFYAKIKYNDWDIVIVPQSTFERIPDSPERELQFIQEKIDEKKHVIEAAQAAGADERDMKRLRKELEKIEEEYGDIYLDNDPANNQSKKKKKDAKREAASLDKAQTRAKEQLDRATDDVQYFDDLGIDALLVDEAHEYKHLGFQTSIGRGIKGIDPSYSKKCAGLYIKTRSVFEKAGWKNVVFATGTPISNTAAEIWTFMKYLMPADVMKANDIYYFDDFVHNFGNISQMLEFATSGKFKENTRFAAYVNKPELIRIWSQVADTVLTKEVGKVQEKIPEMEGGKDQDVFLPQSPSLIRIMAAVRAELERFENMTGQQKKENSSIPLTMYGIAKRAAIDPRLVDADAPDEPMSKTNAAVKEIVKDLKETESYKGTVAVFCDNQNRLDTNAAGKKVVEFNIYDDMKAKLIKAGVPEKQIAIIKSGMSITAKQKIFDAVNSGEIRVVLGSTQTLGTGVNMQERLHLLIHMDAPDRPMDYTQRNGRIKRQGNLHKQWGKTIRVIRFGVEDSLDVTAYQRLKTKSGFIDSIMDGKASLANNQVDRTVEEEEEGLFDNPVAVLSGSQYALKKNQAERELRKYQGKKAQWEADQVYVANQLRHDANMIEADKATIVKEQKELERIKQMFPTGTVKTITVEGVKIDMTKDDGAKKLGEAIKEKINDPVNAIVKRNRENAIYNDEILEYTISLDGHDVNFRVDVFRESVYDNGKMKTVIHKYTSCKWPELNIETLTSSRGVRDYLDEILDQVITGRDNQDRIDAMQQNIERLNAEIEQIKKRVGMPFQFDKELEEAQQHVEEYTKLMKQEMEEKEAKYAAQQKEAETDGKGFNLSKAEDSEEDDMYSADEDWDEPVFYSNAERAVESIRQEKATPEQWIAMLEKNGGLKAGEDKWLGLSDQLKDAARLGIKSIPKNDILNYIHDHQIVVEDVKYGSQDSPVYGNWNREGYGYRNNYDDKMYIEDVSNTAYYDGKKIGTFDNFDDAENALIAYTTDENPIHATRLSYTTRGLNNKREIALVVPTVDPYSQSDIIHFGDAGEGRAVAWIRFGETTQQIPDDGGLKQAEFEKIAADNEKWYREHPEYAKYGIGDEATKQEGEMRKKLHSEALSAAESVPTHPVKVLVIDEIQSKRHQEGREKGYAKRFPYIRLDAARKEYNEFAERMKKEYGQGIMGNYEIWPEVPENVREEIRQAESKLRFAKEELFKIPDAPFDKNWHELAMKRMLRYAAENGYDKIAWTTGEQQAERYSLGDAVKNVEAAISVNGERWTDINLAKGGVIHIRHDNEGNILQTGGNHTTMLGEAKNLSEVIGKELTLKILAQNKTGSDNMVTYKGNDLRIGGEGMKGFYDEILPRFMNKYGKKWEVRTADIQLKGPSESYWENTKGRMGGGLIMHSIDVTPDMKESVMQGQPMFRDMDIFAEGERFPIHTTKGYGSYDILDNTVRFSTDLMPDVYSDQLQMLDAIRRQYPTYYARIEDGHVVMESWQHVIAASDTAARQRNSKQAKAHESYIERKTRNAIKAVNSLAQQMGLSIEVLTTTDGLKGKKARAKGWFNKSTGKITLVLPNHADKSDLINTLLHEGVAHYGLRKMFGPHFDTFLDNVYNNVSPEIKRRIDAAMKRNGWSRQLATEEYLARLAERTDFEHATQQGWWQKIKDFFLQMLTNAGVHMPVPMTDNELRYILWRSYDNLLHPDSRRTLFDLADEIAMKNRLGINRYARERERLQRTGRIDTSRIAAESVGLYAEADGLIESLQKNAPKNIRESLSISERVAQLPKNQLQYAYKKVNGMMLDEDGLDLDDHFEKVKQDWRKEHGLSGIGKVQADELQKAMNKYGEGLITLRWELMDRMDNLGIPHESGEVAEDLNSTDYASDEINAIVDKAKADGTYMLALNGKPSNLNELQWAQVRTQAFKNWFGDWENDAENASKVVDENGEPKVMYHSTNLNWVNNGEPFWTFYEDSHFGTKGQAEDRQTANEGVKIYEVFLNIRNPQRRADADQDYLDDKDMTMSEYWQLMVARSKSQGYDGIVYLNEYEDKKHPADSWIAFNPNQIKSATENSGDFSTEDNDIRYSIRTNEPPKKTGIGYKVFVLKDGQLYPPMVANPNGEGTPVGVWLDADVAPIAGQSKTGRPQVKAGGKGTQGGSGQLAYRPGWHLGTIPYALQFNRKDENGERTLFPNNFVWAEVEYADDVDYQQEARQEGMNANGKYQHSLAGLKHVPTDGSYKYRTNPDPRTDEWIITGAMRVNRILNREEVDELVRKAGREPQPIQDGDILTQEAVDELNAEIQATKEADEMGLLYRDDDAWDDAAPEDAAAIVARSIYNNAVRVTGNATMLSALARAAIQRGEKWEQFKHQFSESWFDYSRSLKALQDAIEKATGKAVAGFEDVWKSLNAKSSIDSIELQEVMDKYIEPLSAYVGQIVKGKKIDGKAVDIDDVEKYLNAVHGQERNVAMAMKQAQDEYDEDTALLRQQLENTSLTDDERNSIEESLLKKEARFKGIKNYMHYPSIAQWWNKWNMSVERGHDNGTLSDEEYNKVRAEMATEYENGWQYKYRDKDYSGLTALFAEDIPEGEEVTEDRLEQLARDYAAKFEDVIGKAECEELWNRVKALNNYSLRKSYLSGLISKQQYDDTLSMYEHYVPLRGWHDDYAGDVYQYISRGEPAEVLQGVLRKAYGRKSRAARIFGTMAAMANTAIVQGNKNTVAQKLLNLAMNHTDANLLMVTEQWYRKDANDNLVPEFPNLREDMTAEEMQAEIERFEEDMKEREERGEVEQLRKKFKKEMPLNMAKWQEQRHAVRVLRNGKEYMVYVLGDPRAAEAFNGLLNPHSQPGAISNVLSRYMRFRAKWQTSLSPEFLISNFQRDVMTATTGAYVKFGKETSQQFAKNLAKVMPLTAVSAIKKGKKADNLGGIFSLLKKYDDGTLDKGNDMERYFDEFVRNGGMTGISYITRSEEYQASMEDIVKRMRQGKLSKPRQWAEAVGDAVEFANKGIENATRFAMFMTSRQQGKTIVQSIFDAKEASVNFNMKGSGAWGNMMARRLYLYVNPAMQALRMLGTWYENDPMVATKEGGQMVTKAIGKRFMKAAAFTLTASIATAALNMLLSALLGHGDDDDDNVMPTDWWALSEWNRYNYVNIVNPFGKGYFHWNLPQELRPIWAMGQIAVDGVCGKITMQHGFNAMLSQLNNLTPLSFFEGGTTSDNSTISSVIRTFTPTFVGEFTDAYGWNRDFMGHWITNQSSWNEDAPEWQRASDDTPKWIVDLSKELNNLAPNGRANNRSDWESRYFNPSAIYYILTQQYGGIGTMGKRFYQLIEQSLDPEQDVEVRNMPFIPKFYVSTGDDYSQNRVMNEKFRMYWNEYKAADGELSRDRKAVGDGTMTQEDADRTIEERKADGSYQTWKAIHDNYLDKLYQDSRGTKNANEVKQMVVDAVEQGKVPDFINQEGKIYENAIKRQKTSQIDDMTDEEMRSTFDNSKDSQMRSMIAKRIATSAGASKDAYGEKSSADFVNIYQELRTANDVYEDALLLSYYEQARESGNDNLKDQIKIERELLRQYAKELSRDYLQDNKDIMKEIRQERSNLIRRLHNIGVGNR